MKKSITLLALLLATTVSSWAQQLYTNGPIATGATSKSGVAAPTGTQWSEVQNDTGNTAVANTNSGYTANQSLGYQLADDFVVPAGQSWTVSSFSFFGYLTGAAATPSPFTELYIQVWNGQPGTAGATVIFGNLTTNRLGTSTDALTYRIFNSLYPSPGNTPGTTRKVWEVQATVAPGLVLAPGTYWVSWSANVTANATHFFVPVTTTGARTQTGANALQGITTAGATTWTALTDAGTGTGATTVNQAGAFRVFGTSATATTATPLFNNGATSLTGSSIATGATSKSGVAAPTGTQWSEVQNDTGNTAVANTNSGYTASTSLGLELADDFVVPAGQRWTISSFSFFGYQTGAAATPSPFSNLTIRVWNGQPGTAGATVVFGDVTTNRLGTSTDVLTYRIFNSLYPSPGNTPGTTRKVWEVQATVAPGLVLTPGTYWISWASTVTGGGTHFYVPVTTTGARTQAGANALQGTTTGTATTWTALVDAGTGTGATTVNQAMAFRVFGTSGPLATRVGQPGPDGLSIQASPVPASEAVQVTLDNLKGSAQLLLTDLNGRLVWTGAVPAGRATATVPVAGLATGIYLLEARTAAGSVRARLVKE